MVRANTLLCNGNLYRANPHELTNADIGTTPSGISGLRNVHISYE